MSEAPLGLLQVLRIKGLASGDELAEALGRAADGLDAELEELAEAGLAERAGEGGWALTPEGLKRQEELAGERRAAGGLADVEVLYEVFLDLNAPVKELVSEWQSGGEAAELAGELAEIDAQLAEGIEIGSRALPRLSAYAERLGAALKSVRGGDGRYVADPMLPSYHTVWFEFHEDLLQTLGRSRAEEEGGT